MVTKVFQSTAELGREAAATAALALQDAIAKRNKARIIAATGVSQLCFLKELITVPGINWQKVEMFHLDEYSRLPMTHRASFRKFLLERFIRPAGIGQYHLLDGEADAAEVCRKAGAELNAAPIDVAFVGVGENGHLAFNDPPADFTTDEPFLIVDLDEVCRKQQVNEGWFKDLAEVPRQAISMSIRQILKARKILCIAPERRKAPAIKACLEGEITPAAPASFLRSHPDVTLFLDADSASLLDSKRL